MKKLLKDMPEHMDRIENNYLLKQDIASIVELNDGDPVSEILEKLTEFVNQNYTFKGI